jgi:hypothetical protein
LGLGNTEAQRDEAATKSKSILAANEREWDLGVVSPKSLVTNTEKSKKKWIVKRGTLAG